MTQLIRSPTTTYEVEKPLARTATYNVYLVNDQADGRLFMLKVSLDIPGNGNLDREVLILNDISAEVKRIRGLEPAATKHGGYRFEKCFPRVHESFRFKEQGNRAINIIDIPAADLDEGDDLMPLERYRVRQRVLIDPKTSAWIMGRMLKMFTLIHPIGIAVGNINGGNLLIRPGEHDVRSHRALFFDWTKAHQYDSFVPPEKVGEEIAHAATTVFKALGGNTGTGVLPASEQLADDRYAKLLVQFMSGRERDPDKARAYFYDVINNIWESHFHPFTTIPI